MSRSDLLKAIKNRLSSDTQQNITLSSHKAPKSLSSKLPKRNLFVVRTQLLPAWPIIWYLTTWLQDTCSFQLKCHWGILSAPRHLGLTYNFTFVCYKAENAGQWPCFKFCQHQRWASLLGPTKNKNNKIGAYFEGQNSHYLKVLQLKLNVILPATLVWELPL